MGRVEIEAMGDALLAIQWPNPQDYNEAVQFPEVSFEDVELQNGEVELTPIGLPKVASGNFAGVYKFECGSKDYAVKCFLRNVYDQHRRYSLLSQFTTTTNVPHMVDFEYILKGIRVEENWFPIVKMEWVDGLGLDQFIRKNWSNRPEINRVITQFTQLMRDLHDVGVAHCDLQHGNILVKTDSIKLVDYDNMFVPLMAGELSAELGHSNYQHLTRSEKDFGSHMDNFSAWIIYYSLFLLRLDSALWQKHQGGDDCLLFRKSDFGNPTGSRLIAEIKNHAIPDIQAQFEPIMRLLHSPIDQVPKFGVQRTGEITSPGTTGGNGPQQAAAEKPPPVYPQKWPTSEQYFWAAVKPRQSYSDEKLARGVPVPTQGQTTKNVEADATTRDTVQIQKLVIRGRHNIVFHVVGEQDADGNRKHYAVKCFLHNVPDRHVRYSAVFRHKKAASNQYFVPFQYQQQGIKVGNDWFPILKMLWVNGETLESYVRTQLGIGATSALEELLPKFVSMMQALSNDGIAHGDLEPSNILIDEHGNLRIIDYDAMYVPALANLQSCELGLKSLQHPARNLSNYGEYLDNMSALIIYGLLSCMSRRPPERLWQWDALLQHIRSQPLQTAKQEGPAGIGRRPTSDGFIVPKQRAVTKETSNSLFNPIFEKATITEVTSTTFESASQRFSRVLREQQKRRIDQVSKLDVTVWNMT